MKNYRAPDALVDFHTGPSYLNHDEATCVVALLESLLRCDRVQCEPRDVGVLCAFRAQTILIRQMLRAKNLGNVMVGQIYDFQGCEHKVVIARLCVDINQRVACIDSSSQSHSSTRTRSSCLNRAVRDRPCHAIEQASRRWRGDRRGYSGRTRRKI